MITTNPLTKKEEGFYPEEVSGIVLIDLMKLVKQYVQNEEFEKAAEVRDEIRGLETQLSEHREGE